MMTKKVKCQKKGFVDRANRVRVRIIKAPLVNSRELEQIILCRAKALVL